MGTPCVEELGKRTQRGIQGDRVYTIVKVLLGGPNQGGQLQ